MLCRQCGKEICVRPVCPTKPELAMAIGDTFETQCVHCGHRIKREAGDVEAARGRAAVLSFVILFPLLGLMALLISSFVMGGLSGLLMILVVILIPSLVAFTINKEENRKVTAFNRSGKKKFNF